MPFYQLSLLLASLPRAVSVGIAVNPFRDFLKMIGQKEKIDCTWNGVDSNKIYLHKN